MSGSRKNKAVALKYNPTTDVAPIVVASGYGLIAENIINIGEEKGIPIFKDDSAASMLCMLEIGSKIPDELYEVIALVYTKIMQRAQEIEENRSK